MSFEYDRYGNRTKQQDVNTGYGLTPLFDAATNRISGVSYDATGNLLNDAGDPGQALTSEGAPSKLGLGLGGDFRMPETPLLSFQAG